MELHPDFDAASKDPLAFSWTGLSVRPRRAQVCVDEPYVPNENGPAALDENEVFDSQYLWKIEEATDHKGNQVSDVADVQAYRLHIRSALDGGERCTMYISPEQLAEIGELFTALSVDDDRFDRLVSLHI